jgi:hypothetical protein
LDLSNQWDCRLRLAPSLEGKEESKLVWLDIVKKSEEQNRPFFITNVSIRVSAGKTVNKFIVALSTRKRGLQIRLSNNKENLSPSFTQSTVYRGY